MNKKTFLRKFNVYICDMEKHEIEFEELTIEAYGYYEDPDDTTGYKGGWSSDEIYLEGIDIKWMLKPSIIDKINSQIANQRQV